MIISFSCIAILVIGITLRKFSDKITDVDFSLASEGLGVILIFFGVVGIITIAVSLPMMHSSIKSDILQFEEAKSLYELAREEEDMDMELVAFELKIVEENRWLRNKQYWNDTIFGIFIPDSVMKLKPIR